MIDDAVQAFLERSSSKVDEQADGKLQKPEVGVRWCCWPLARGHPAVEHGHSRGGNIMIISTMGSDMLLPNLLNGESNRATDELLK